VEAINPGSTASRRVVEARASTGIMNARNILLSYIDDDAVADFLNAPVSFSHHNKARKKYLRVLVVTQLYKPYQLRY
jgi:hypothetical protein